ASSPVTSVPTSEPAPVTSAPASEPAPLMATSPQRGVRLPPELDLGGAIPDCPALEAPAAMATPPARGPADQPQVAAGLPQPLPRSLDTLVVGKDVSAVSVAGKAGRASSERSESSALVAAERSEQLEQIAREADRHTRRGFELAGRNAVFAARHQFIVAMRLVAQGLDTEHKTRTHSQALAEGLDAVREADDFIPRGARMEADLNMAAIIRAHRTPVLKQSDPGSLTPMVALKSYFTFAQQRLADAMHTEAAGSMALHGLGKLHGSAARNPAIELAAAEPKAVAFFQAALLVHPRNLMAANDLGVLLAQAGQWAGARQVLEYTVAVNPQSISWKNLTKVYRQLNDAPRARHAQQMADAAARLEIARRGGVSRSDKVQWLAPGTFAGTHVDSRVGPGPRTGQSPSPGPDSKRR
ncbi:MAG: hypothetical protein U1E05_27870, partial [Patescibacteria group bacterium]|nr:hypothetical protein [Patescibacteria group bacterium]